MAEIAAGIAISAALSVATTVVTNALQKPNEQTRLSDINPLKASFGEALPIVYGKARVPGIIFWATPLKEKVVDDVYQYKGTCSVALATSHSPSGIYQINKIYTNKRLNYEFSPSPTNRYTFHLGSAAQSVDSTIEFFEGTAFVPRFKNIVYFTYINQKLVKFGNALPSFEAEIQSHSTSPTLRFVIEHQLSLQKIPSNLYSFVQSAYFDNTLVESAVFKNDGSSVASFLEELQLAYGFTVRVNNGLLEFAPVNNRGIIVIPKNKMGCQPDSQGIEENDADSDSGRLYVKQEEFEIDLPDTVQVEYLSTIDSFQKHIATYKDTTKRQDNTKTIQFSDVRLNNTKALQLAQEGFNYVYASSKKYSGLQYPYLIPATFQEEYSSNDTAQIIPGDVYSIPLDSGNYNQTITSVDISPGFIQNVSSHTYVGDDGFIPYTSTDSFTPETVKDSFTEVTPIFLETSPLRPFISTTRVDLLVGASTTPPQFNGGTARFNGASIASVSDILSTGAISGAILPKASHLIPDETSELRVTLSYPIGNVATNEWLNAKQVLLLGTGELILVREATNLGGNLYSCKGLVRGWQGTEVFIGNPTPIGTSVYRVQYSNNQSNNSMANGGSNDYSQVLGISGQLTLFGYDADDEQTSVYGLTVTPTGRSLKPFAPAGFYYESATRTINWARRARGYFSNNFNPSLNEVSERYAVRFYSGSIFTTLLDLRVVNNPNITLTPSEVTIFSSTSGTFNIDVRQLSDIVGEGFAGRANLLPF